MSAMIKLEGLQKEHTRVKNRIESGTIKVIHYDSAHEFLKTLHKI